MKVLLITNVFYPEPIVMATIVEDLAIALSHENEVTVLSSKPCRPYGYRIPNVFNKSIWPFKRVIFDSYVYPQSEVIGRLKENLSFGKMASDYIVKHKDEIDVIYLSTFPLFAPKRVIKTAQRCGIPIVNHIEDIYPEPFREKQSIYGKLLYKLLLPIDKWIVNNATVSVVIGNKIKEYIINSRNVPPYKIEVVYNWQDETRFLGNYPYPKSGFTFLYAGSVSKATGLQTVIEAFGESGLEDARFVICGSGTEKEALQNVASMYPKAQIIFQDAPVEKIAQLQASADVLVLPLRPHISQRAVPSKFAAYLMSKRPVLAFVEPESDVADIIRQGQCGWVAKAGDKNDMVRAFKDATKTNKISLEEMGTNGNSYYFSHLTKATNLSKLVDIVESVNSR